MRTSEIAEQVGVGPTNLSFHLTELGRSGLLRRNRGALLREARIKKLEREQLLLGGRPTDFADVVIYVVPGLRFWWITRHMT